MTGPLHGVRIIEMGGIGPGPLAGMLLADHGAEVIRVERPNGTPSPMLRSRKIVHLDLKQPAQLAQLKTLIENADCLVEGYRPGVMERLGLGPDVLCAANAKLVYARITGWGQTGPLAETAGHDINYISLTGALHAIGSKQRPYAPLALVGDFGGGGMLLAYSIATALLHANRTGKGQVIDCAMMEGAALLMTAFHEMIATKEWIDARESNLLDGAAHFYGVYETSDDKFVSIGSIEPQFYAILLEKLGLSNDADFQQQLNQSKWPALRTKLTAIFKTKTRDEWNDIFGGTDTCFAPVLSLTEASSHPHAKARGSYVEIGGQLLPAPAPRFSSTPLSQPIPPATVDISGLIDPKSR